MENQSAQTMSYGSGSSSDVEEEFSSSELALDETRLNREKAENAMFFVCTSNTCRSPMAEGVAKALVKKKKLPLEIGSFGVWAWGDSPASQQGVEICASDGIDISKSTSTKIEDVDFQNYKNIKIVCMSNWHQQDVRKYVNKRKDLNIKTEDIVLLDPNGENVYDPVGSPKARYRQVYNFMKPHIEQKVLDYGTSFENENENDDLVLEEVEEIN